MARQIMGRTLGIRAAAVGLTFLGAAANASAQEPCSACQTYRVQYQTVFEDRQVTAYRIGYETVYDERQITTYRPTWETELRERRYTVATPVVETSEREERYTVLKPVYETQVRDASYDVVRTVSETSEREERYIVQRPVMHTEERENRYMVQRPVNETIERDEQYTVMTPVTTYRPVVVDQGGFVDQQIVTPGRATTRMKILPDACVTDPATGQQVFQRGGLNWVREQCPDTVTVNRVWKPNLVTQQVPQVSMVPQVAVRKVPMTVCKMVPEEVVQKYNVQVCQMVPEEQVRKIPVVTYRQITERVPREISVQVCKMVPEEVVQRIPVRTMKTVVEERVEQVPVRVCKQVAELQTIRVPRTIETRTPVTYTYRIPRTIVSRVPIVNPCDPCAAGGVVAMPVVPAAGVMAPLAPAPAPAPSLGTETPVERSAPQKSEPAKAAPNSSTEGTNGSSNGATQKPGIGPEVNVPNNPPAPLGPNDAGSDQQNPGATAPNGVRKLSSEDTTAKLVPLIQPSK